eukprot:3093451-Amphidinium_carterae.2
MFKAAIKLLSSATNQPLIMLLPHCASGKTTVQAGHAPLETIVEVVSGGSHASVGVVEKEQSAHLASRFECYAAK